MKVLAIACSILGLVSGTAARGDAGFLPGARTVFEAHNCYPYFGLWRDRIDRALETGFPLGIELDLMWQADGETGRGRLVVAHHASLAGRAPTLAAYFFERVRPTVEHALSSGQTRAWPLITLNVNDIRSDRPEAFRELWRLTGRYESWLCTARKGEAPDPVAPMEVRPVLVLAGGGPLETRHFYEAVPVGGRLRIFGSGRGDRDADNFRRWLNYAWRAVEPGGQRRAGAWTEEKAAHLNALVRNAHARGYWVRFYALNGHGRLAGLRHGLNPGYNFGSLEAARIRWEVARRAGADFVATDQIREAKASP